MGGMGWGLLVKQFPSNFIIAENSAIYIYAFKIIVWSFHLQIIIVFYKLKCVCLCVRACMYLDLSRICDKLRLKLCDSKWKASYNGHIAKDQHNL